MLKQLFGKYLVENGKLTKAQYQIVSEKQASARVKLGLIAIEEKLLTKEQAEELNQLQTQMDKRFGDLAVEKGYLTDEQVSMLLKKQGNAYLQFIQTISEAGFMSLNEIDENLMNFIKEAGYTKDEIDALKSGDVTNMVTLFVDKSNDKLTDLLSMILRNITRFISTDYYIEKAEKISEFKFANMSGQSVVGDDEYTIAFADEEGAKAITYMASTYSKAPFALNSPEVFDSIGEFTNCVNGLYVSKEALEASDIDMLPPFGYKEGMIKGDLYKIPLNLAGANLAIIVAINNKPEFVGNQVEAVEATENEIVNKDGKKILIVDDSRMSRSVLRTVLEAAGYCVVGEAINGKEAVNSFIKLKPDLITMDITMPVMDGIQALKEIRKLDENAKIVMLSAAGMKAKIVEAIKLGAIEFISKPFEKETIERVLKEVLK